jgi:integrase
MTKEEQRRMLVLSDEECDRLMAAAMEDIQPLCGLFVGFLLGTGARHSEVLSARYDKIDFDRLRWEIPTAKAGRRSQPFTPALRAMLLRERELTPDRDGWCFLGSGSSGHITRMDLPFARAVRAAGLDEATTAHALRHTAITKLVEAGTPLPVIMQISGHKTLAMVMRYTHVRGRSVDQAIAVLDRNPMPSYTRITHFPVKTSDDSIREERQVLVNKNKKQEGV